MNEYLLGVIAVFVILIWLEIHGTIARMREANTKIIKWVALKIDNLLMWCKRGRN